MNVSWYKQPSYIVCMRHTDSKIHIKNIVYEIQLSWSETTNHEKCVFEDMRQ